MRDLLILRPPDRHPRAADGPRRSAVCRRRVAFGQAATAHSQSLATPGAEPPRIGSIVAGVCALFMRPARVLRSAVVLRPSTILDFHRMLRRRKYRWLFAPRRRRTGPKGPPKVLVDAIVEMKRRNPRWGCPRIAQQIGLAFDIQIDKDVVRRVLAAHYRPAPNSSGPSWLTFLGQTKDSLWSIDLFRCESALLRSHWVLVVMDHYTRRIVGFGVHAGIVDGRALCRMFSHAIRGPLSPTRLSADHDPLYRFHQWHANLRVLRVTEVKSVPYVPRVPSVCRTADRHVAARVCGSDAVLVRIGLGTQAGSLPGLLQRASSPCRARRTDARPDTEGCRASRSLRLASALPRALSDTHRGVTSEHVGPRVGASALDVYHDRVGQCVSRPSDACYRCGVPDDSRLRDVKIERCLGFLRIRHPHVRGRPRRRRALPSYFCAMSRRYQRRIVSGVTIPATRLKTRRPSFCPRMASRRR